MAIQAPYLNSDTGLFDEGVCCRACANQGWENLPSVTEAQVRILPYPIWGVPYRRYTSAGIKAHLEEFGRVLQVSVGRDESRNEKGVCFVHESPLHRYVKLSECQADELVRMCAVLSRCRDKTIEFEPLRTILPQWYAVPSKGIRQCPHRMPMYSRCPCRECPTRLFSNCVFWGPDVDMPCSVMT